MSGQVRTDRQEEFMSEEATAEAVARATSLVEALVPSDEVVRSRALSALLRALAAEVVER